MCVVDDAMAILKQFFCLTVYGTVVISCTRDITHNTHAECFVVVVFEDNEVNRPLLDYLLLFLKSQRMKMS